MKKKINFLPFDPNILKTSSHHVTGNTHIFLPRWKPDSEVCFYSMWISEAHLLDFNNIFVCVYTFIFDVLIHLFQKIKMSDRKKQIRFKSDDDIKLLREVLASNPWRNKGKWTEIASTLSKPGFMLDMRRVRERTLLLLDQHKANERENLKR